MSRKLFTVLVALSATALTQTPSLPQSDLIPYGADPFMIVAYEPGLPFGKGLTGLTLQFAPSEFGADLFQYCTENGSQFMLAPGIHGMDLHDSSNASKFASTTAAVFWTDTAGKAYTNCKGTLIPLVLPNYSKVPWPLSYFPFLGMGVSTGFYQLGTALFPYTYDTPSLNFSGSYLNPTSIGPPTGLFYWAGPNGYNWTACEHAYPADRNASDGKTYDLWQWQGRHLTEPENCTTILLAAVGFGLSTCPNWSCYPEVVYPSPAPIGGQPTAGWF